MAISLKGRKLYHLTGSDFRIPRYLDDRGKIVDQAADNIPILLWPNGHWCGPANTFMRESFEAGLSRWNRGGTLSTQAAHLSLLIRFTFALGKSFLDLTDADFRSFVDFLVTENGRGATGRRRSHNGVIAVGKTCLAFLSSVGRAAGRDNFLGPNGQIRATRVEPCPRDRSARTTRTFSRPAGWTHNCLPNPSVFKTRLPVGKHSIDALRVVVGHRSRSGHIRQRRHTMLKVLESTGCRRGEAAFIKVCDVERAIRMARPMLKLPLLKRRDVKERVLPVSRADLGFIKIYIDVHRRSVMRRTYSGRQDHGYLLVNDRTGNPLTPGAITQEISALARAAGIQQQLCPHMFRHRFFTKIVVMLIREFTLKTPDEFRRALLDGYALRRRAMEWTGHSNPESLTPYVHLAFDELTHAERVVRNVEAGLALDSYRELLGVELLALESGEDPQEVTKRIMNWTECVKADLSTPPL